MASPLELQRLVRLGWGASANGARGVRRPGRGRWQRPGPLAAGRVAVGADWFVGGGYGIITKPIRPEPKSSAADGRR